MGVDAYAKVLRKIHRYGISVLGAFFFGLDSDSRGSLRERAQFILKSSVDAWQTTILTPLPGTGLYDRLFAENRILFTDYPDDWSRYDFTEPVFVPKQMSNEELRETMHEVLTRIYNRKTVRKQLRRPIWNLRKFKPAMWGYVTNYNNYCMSFEGKIQAEDPLYTHWLLSEEAEGKP